MNWRPKVREAQTRTFTDEIEGESVDFTFTLREPTEPEEMRAYEDAQKLIQQHITGTETEPPVPFFAAGGEPVEVTETSLFNACIIAAMQPPFVPAEDRWSAIEIVIMRARASRKFRKELSDWVGEISKGKVPNADGIPQALAEDAKNPIGAGMN